MNYMVLDNLTKTRIYGRPHTTQAPIPLTEDSDIQIIPGHVMDFLRQNHI